MILRVTISIALLCLSIAVIAVTDWDSIKYFSQWALYGATILYALMAYVQVKTSIEIKDFRVEITEIRRNSWI